MSTGTTALAGPSETAPRRGRGLVAMIAIVLVVAVVLAGSLLWLTRGPSGRFADAMGSLPEQTARSSFTDWTVIRERLDVPDLEQSADPDLVTRFLDQAYDLDLVTGSTQLDVVPALARNYGYSLDQLEWEAYGQSEAGAVSVVKVTEDVDFEKLAGNLESLGYEPPQEDGGTWRGTGDLVAQLDTPMSTLQINVLMLADERLVLTSDTASYLAGAGEVMTEGEPSLREVAGVDDLIGAAEEAESAQLWARDFACSDLGMSQADPADRDEAARLIEAVGGVTPIGGLLMARSGGRGATFGWWFDTAEDADDELQPRTDLARGPAPGQGGDFSERFSVVDSRVQDQLITMQVRAETETLMGDLGQGPILFAAC